MGITGDLSQRLPGHDMWSAAVRLGATHIQAHTTPAGEQARLDEEEDLIARWNPARTSVGAVGRLGFLGSASDSGVAGVPTTPAILSRMEAFARLIASLG